MESRGTAPLPPGYAEDAAFAREQPHAAVARTASSLATRERDSVDGVVLAPPTVPNADSAVGDAQSAPPQTPSHPRDYLVMLAVFLVPLLLLVPVVWVWYILRNLRLTTSLRRAPEAESRRGVVV